MQDNIITEGVKVFRVNQQPVHVEKAGPHRRKAKKRRSVDDMKVG